MRFFADSGVVAIDAMAVLIIVVSTLEMFVTCVRSVFSPPPTSRDLRDGYWRYVRWLMAGLTFQSGERHHHFGAARRAGTTSGVSPRSP